MDEYWCRCGKRKKLDKVACCRECPEHPRLIGSGHGMHMQRFTTDKYDNTGITIHHISMLTIARIGGPNVFDQ